MKGRITANKILPSQQILYKSRSQTCDQRHRKYSKSFLELMEKALNHLKSKQKIQKRYSSNKNKCYQTFVHGLFPTQKHLLSKHRHAQKSIINVSSQQIPPIKKQQSRIKTEFKQKTEQISQTLKSVQMKQQLMPKKHKLSHIYAYKHMKINLSIKKNRNQNESNMSEKDYNSISEQSQWSRNKMNNLKRSLMSDQHIEPWATIEENQYSIKLCF